MAVINQVQHECSSGFQYLRGTCSILPRVVNDGCRRGIFDDIVQLLRRRINNGSPDGVATPPPLPSASNLQRLMLYFCNCFFLDTQVD